MRYTLGLCLPLTSEQLRAAKIPTIKILFILVFSCYPTNCTITQTKYEKFRQNGLKLIFS